MGKFDTGGVSEFSHFLLYFYSLFTYQTCVMGGGRVMEKFDTRGGGGVEPKFNPECVQSKLNARGGGFGQTAKISSGGPPVVFNLNGLALTQNDIINVHINVSKY